MNTEKIVHIHNHAGWKTFTVHAATDEHAFVVVILQTHGFLSEFQDQYEISFDRDGYAVKYTGPPRPIFGGTQYPGDHWFSDLIRIGEADDCYGCGGTGVNHYYGWRQCWKCGDQKLDGQSSGKICLPVE